MAPISARPGPSRFDLAEAVPGPSTEHLGALAKQNGIVIVASLFERRAAGLYHNAAVVTGTRWQPVRAVSQDAYPRRPGYYESSAPGDLGSPRSTPRWDASAYSSAGISGIRRPPPDGTGRCSRSCCARHCRRWDMRDDDAEALTPAQAWLTVQRGHAVANGIPASVAIASVSRRHRMPSMAASGYSSSFACSPGAEWIDRRDSTDLIVDINLARSEDVRRMAVSGTAVSTPMATSQKRVWAAGIPLDAATVAAWLPFPHHQVSSQPGTAFSGSSPRSWK